jgi:hypothetical protein
VCRPSASGPTQTWRKFGPEMDHAGRLGPDASHAGDDAGDAPVPSDQ